MIDWVGRTLFSQCVIKQPETTWIFLFFFVVTSEFQGYDCNGTM